MDLIEFREKLKHRTKLFALEIIRLYQILPKNDEIRILGKQVIRSGTSVAANYRAACRARSSAELYSKLSIVVEEADETLFWLELIEESSRSQIEKLNILKLESEELLKIYATARKNAKK